MLERLTHKGQIAGALVSIDAIGCNAGTAQAILDAWVGYLVPREESDFTRFEVLQRHVNGSASCWQ
jgi:hypothetical protein